MLLALILAASPVAEATADYADLDYEACVSRLTTTKVAPKDRAPSDLLLGLCHFALGHSELARTYLEAALKREPAISVPSAAGPKERALVDELRRSARATAKRPQPGPGPRPSAKSTEPSPPPPSTEPAPPAPPIEVSKADVPLAATSTPAPVLTPPAPAPTAVTMTASAPPAPKPWWPYLVGGLGLVAGGAAVGFGLAARSAEQAAQNEPVQVRAAALKGTAERDATVTNVAIGVASAAVVTAVVGFVITR